MKFSVAIVFLALCALGQDARVVWSTKVGHLDGGQARVDITAVIVADDTQPGHVQRGVRMDLASPGWQGTVYIEEAMLSPLARILDQLSRDLQRTSVPGGYLGSCEFRNHPEYPVMVDYYLGSDDPGLRILLVRGGSVRLASRKPADLSELITKAIDALKAH